MSEAAARLERHRRLYSLALIDIDNFKPSNDMHGHQAGDDTLRVEVATVSDRLRRADGLARWGGEAFALLLTETDLPAVIGALKALRQTIKAQRQGTTDGLRRVITISIGVGQADVGEDVDRLLQRVDAALYRGKAAGRDRVQRA